MTNVAYQSFATIRLIVLLVFSVLVNSIANQAIAQRKVFLSGEDAATAVDWDFMVSSGRNSGFWTTIPVPSNWQMEGFGRYLYGMDKMEDRVAEVGRYRHEFEFATAPGKRYFLVFQGSMTDTKVKLNGKHVGFHQGGFVEFKFEITESIQDGENFLEVEVDSSSTNESVVAAERFADFWLFGGIFRPVFIEEVPEEFIERVAIDARMDGAFEMDVFTSGMEDADQVCAQVYDDKQQKVGQAFQASITDNKTRLKAKLDGIRAWSHETPDLYTVEVTLKNQDKLLHRYEERFGFRTFEVRDHDGFYLNGKRLLLKGASMHSFRPETGRTLSKQDMEENVHLMKRLNFNCVRSSCYPPDKHFLEACDTEGMLCLNELGGWWRPLDKEVGPKVVKELVARDVNHPSVILWGNGNHMAHTPEFDAVFARWDIQNRRPLKNEAKSNDIFKNYDPDFDIVNTTYYPNYEAIQKGLFEEDHIFLPNECLHALYDGGGGANLQTYWDAFESSKVGGGLMIWALFDEAIMRNDKGYTVDNQDSKAADGIVGPHLEPKGSYYAVREIWSPVVIADTSLDTDFDGTIDVHNKFTFLNLNECEVLWNLVNFANPDSAANGHRTVASGTVVADIPAGEKGQLSIQLPKTFPKSDALAIEVYDREGDLVYEKRLPISHDRPAFRAASEIEFTQSAKDPFQLRRGKTSLRFDPKSGVLVSVMNGGKKTSIGSFPFLTYEAAKKSSEKSSETDQGSRNGSSVTSEATIEKEGKNFIIEANGTKGFDSIQWLLKPNGEIVLNYAYTLKPGKYRHAGIGMEVASQDVKRKRWMGEGPARIWKNRTQGGLLDVFAVDKKVNIPGRVYNPPEFEGCFAPWNWAVFYLNNNVSLAFQNKSDAVLGVLNPVNGAGPKFAAWSYPKQEGFFFFDCISPVGSKWKSSDEFGPDAQPTVIENQIKGTVAMFINWNDPGPKARRVDLEIE